MRNKMTRQVKFYDKDNDEILGGILDDKGNIICGCCGSLIEADDIGYGDDKSYRIEATYYDWHKVSDIIINNRKRG